MDPTPRFRIPVLLLFAGVPGCNLVTGASEYDQVDRCTGPLCGVCPSGQAWDPDQEACVENAVWCTRGGGSWDEQQKLCLPEGTCPAGQRWYEGIESCVPACDEGTAECGLSCCGFGLLCVPDTNGNPICSTCPAVELVCGDTCCEVGAVCIDASRSVCSATYGHAGQSCEGGLACQGDSCCESVKVPGGTFQMGASESDDAAYADERPEHPVTVSPYRMDKYEVTVGRFRTFVEGWDGEPPPGGAGAHPRIGGSGWRSVWNARLPDNREALIDNLSSCGTESTWLAGDDSLPINCVSWFEAFAFCAWDGGRLATEAEWELAASGGQDRMYPWGELAPTSDLAVFQCAEGGSMEDCTIDDIVSVGSKPHGRGRWGHLDLAGSMYEWVLDVFDIYASDPCVDCANAADVPVRVMRGGSWVNDESYLRASFRNTAAPGYRDYDVGIRCARAAD